MARMRAWVWPLAGALFLAACDAPVGPSVPAAGGRIAGLTLTDWSAGGYATPEGMAARDALRARASSLALVVTAYQENARAPRLRDLDPRTPTPAAVGAALGLPASPLDFLKPHVDLDDAAWRGTIEPPEPAAWFESYRAFLLPWASFAESLGVGHFVVGTELASTVRHEAEWRRTIAEVRERFTGVVLYAASWDEAERVGFWDALDLVGVNAYFPVAQRRDPGREELLAGWQPWLERLDRLHRRAGRRILISEIGYASVDGAGLDPFRLDPDAALDPAEQADLYAAAFLALDGAEWLEGTIWWDWPASGEGGPGHRGYTARGKPAEQVLAAAFAPYLAAGP